MQLQRIEFIVQSNRYVCDAKLRAHFIREIQVVWETKLKFIRAFPYSTHGPHQCTTCNSLIYTCDKARPCGMRVSQRNLDKS